MVYTTIQPAAFVPSPDGHGFHTLQYTLAFPAAWREDALTLFRRGKKDPDKYRTVPVGRLNAAVNALAPDLVSVATRAPLDDTKPWLYTTREFPQAATNRLIAQWLMDIQPEPDAFTEVKEAWHRLAASELTWNLTSVDLLEQQTSAGGTAMPAAHLYRLLPDVLAGRIEKAEPYEYCGVQVRFRRAAGNAAAGGAELISWPPLEHTTVNRKTGAVRSAKYSGTITLSLRTEPFSPVPRIHVNTGIRRWVTSSEIRVAPGRDVGVYLMADSSLLPEAPTPRRFALAMLHRDRYSEPAMWSQGGPAGMLRRLTTSGFPDAEQLRTNPSAWLETRDGVTAAAVHHTTMGWHDVGTGLMAPERRRLTEWVGEQLAPEFVPLAELHRVPFPVRKSVPIPILEPKKPIKKLHSLKDPGRAADERERAEIEAENALRVRLNAAIEEENALTAARNSETLADNGGRRRALVAQALGPLGLTVQLAFQSDMMRDALLSAIEVSLDLAPWRDEAGPLTWTWHAPDLSVRVYARQLGALGGPLGGGERAPRRGNAWDEAIAARRSEARVFSQQLAKETDDPAQLALIELDGRKAFASTADPKHALRLGYADAGLVSQFLRSQSIDPRDGKDDAGFRAAAAWEDGLRQLGVRFVPPHSLGDAIPDGLNQLAFWLVKRGTDGPTGKPQFTPIAVLSRPGEPCIKGRSPQTEGWVPYPELLRALTGQIRERDLASEAEQTAATTAFVKNTLREFRIEPTIVVAHAQNTRSRWPWLKNDELLTDRLSYGPGPAQRLSLQGRQLRVARITTDERCEAPQWWAPDGPDSAGISKGLWTAAQASPDSRVFYSTADKGVDTVAKFVTKLTPHLNARGLPEINSTVQARTPGLLQFVMAGLQDGDDPATWAMFLHQQRFTDDYRSGLALPLILHLAKLTTHYALPHEEEKEGEVHLPDDADEVAEFEQLAFDFDAAEEEEPEEL